MLRLRGVEFGGGPRGARARRKPRGRGCSRMQLCTVWAWWWEGGDGQINSAIQFGHHTGGNSAIIRFCRRGGIFFNSAIQFGQPIRPAEVRPSHFPEFNSAIQFGQSIRPCNSAIQFGHPIRPSKLCCYLGGVSQRVNGMTSGVDVSSCGWSLYR